MTKIYKIINITLILIGLCSAANSKIEDSLFASVGAQAITNSDVVNEIKMILIMNNKTYNKDEKKQIQSTAINEVVKRAVKKIEVSKYEGLSYSIPDLNMELERIANNLSIDTQGLKDRFEKQGIDFLAITESLRIELLWNSLISNLYEDRLNVNLEEIDEQVSLYKNKKDVYNYLISEIVIKPASSSELKSEIKKIKDKIALNGFEKTAIEFSVSETASKGGNLGWINEGIIAKKFKSQIINTNVGNVAEPIILQDGILFFKIRDKKIVTKNINIDEVKNKLIFNEKNKILNMYSLTHFEKVKRNIVIKYY